MDFLMKIAITGENQEIKEEFLKKIFHNHSTNLLWTQGLPMGLFTGKLVTMT
ncbi:MAG: hypothetical protein ACW967_03960 [Candidatus Hodarchaeales archaeon]|jgi:hypothetical protein